MKISFTKKSVFGIAVVNFILVGIFFYWFALRRTPAEEMELRCNAKILEDNLIGQSLPNYKLADRDGTDVYQNLTHGKTLIVVFFTHCQACLAEFNWLERHYSELSSKVNIVAVTPESGEIVNQFINKHKFSFPMYFDVEGALMLKARVACTPTMLFLENGIVRKVKIGKTNNYKEITEGF